MSRLGAVGVLVVAVIGFRMAGWLHGGSNYYAPGPSITGTLLEIVGVLVVAVIGLGVAGWLLGGGYYVPLSPGPVYTLPRRLRITSTTKYIGRISMQRGVRPWPMVIASVW
jgi:hypothetical protein